LIFKTPIVSLPMNMVVVGEL